MLEPVETLRMPQTSTAKPRLERVEAQKCDTEYAEVGGNKVQILVCVIRLIF